MSGALIDPRLGRITVDEWWHQWWPTVTNLRASTRARDAQYYNSHVCPAFGDTPLNKLDRTSLRSWLARLGSPRGADLAPATIHKIVQILNKTVNAAFEDRLIPHNPVAKLPLPKIERQEVRFLSSDELWRLADAMDERYRAFDLVAGFGGLRLGELLGLRWSRVDLDTGRIRVAETSDRRCSAGGSVNPPFGLPSSHHCRSTISDTPPCRSGSPTGQTRSKSPHSPATHGIRDSRPLRPALPIARRRLDRAPGASGALTSGVLSSAREFSRRHRVAMRSSVARTGVVLTGERSWRCL